MKHLSKGWILSFSIYFFLITNADSAPIQVASAKNYAEVQSFMKKMAADHSDHAKLFDLGESDNGQMIQGLMLGSGPAKNLVVATHHGNEYGSTALAIAFAQSLAEAPIKGQTVFVIPVLNISGFDARRREEYAKNVSHDPNRDYPGPCGTAGPFNLKSTAALAKLIDAQNIIASATLHTFQPAVVYPWGFSTRDTSTTNDDLFIMLAKAATIESHYEIGNSTEVIYPANGTFEDYAYWKHGIWSLLFELGYSHSPNSKSLEEMIRVNLPGLRQMLEQAPLARADKHSFDGKCDARIMSLDRHDE